MKKEIIKGFVYLVGVKTAFNEDYIKSLSFEEFKNVLKSWAKHFKENKDLIFLGKNYLDIDKARKENKTAIFYGFQNCSPIEDDIN